MTQFSWAPSLVVLAAGLVGGLLIAWRLRRGRSASTDKVDLEIRDLEARRDDLYRRLRDERETLTATEVEQLEQAAARTLRDLDAARERLPESATVERSPAAAAEAAGVDEPAEPRAAPAGAGSFITRRPLMSGFLLGAGMIAVVGLLVYWAIRDTSGSMAMGGAADAGTAEVPHQEGDLPPAVQEEYEALQARLAESPDDVAARKRLAVLLLGHEQYFAAFREAQTLLELVPGDIDGLYVDAVVRLQMGQFGDAISGLDQVIDQFPDHVQALAWRGIAHYQLGDVSSAIASWERGIEAAGGFHPELEQMVLAARQEALAEPEAGQATDSTAPPSPRPSSSPPPVPVATEGSVFFVEIRLAPEVKSAPPGVLFVALRDVPGAPPVAVRRVGTAVFPLTVTMTSDDSMMGSPLPDSGVVTVRLDQDGDVTSVDDGDLVAAAEATSGQPVVVLLAP